MGLLHARKKLPIQELIWNILFREKLIVKGRQQDSIMKDLLGIQEKLEFSKLYSGLI